MAHQQLIHLAAEPLHFLLIDLSLLLQFCILTNQGLAVLVSVLRLPILLSYGLCYHVSVDAGRQLHHPTLLRLAHYAVETE